MRKGLSLIELLVVIAIIAVLSGLLTWVTLQAINEAKKAQTLSNLSQILKAGMLYSESSDGMHPPFDRENPHVATMARLKAQLKPFGATDEIFYSPLDRFLKRPCPAISTNCRDSSFEMVAFEIGALVSSKNQQGAWIAVPFTARTGEERVPWLTSVALEGESPDGSTYPPSNLGDRSSNLYFDGRVELVPISRMSERDGH
ncbi:MAG: type II secretion system protein [Fimbriimonadaceae bacterium]